MKDIDDLLDPDAIFFGVEVTGKRDLFRVIAGHAATIAGIEAGILEAQLLEREALGSTGFGGGVAIPHGQIDRPQKPFGLFLKLAKGVDYDAVDGLPVDCVFALFSTNADCAEHLRALAQVSRRYRDTQFVRKLRGARSADALFALMTSFKAADAA